MSIPFQIAENILLLSFIGIAYFLLESHRESFGDFKTNSLKQSVVLIEASHEAARRRSELNQNMLAYACKAQLNPVLLNLNEVVEETGKWLRRNIERSMESRTDLFPDGSPLTRCVRTKTLVKVYNGTTQSRASLVAARDINLSGRFT